MNANLRHVVEQVSPVTTEPSNGLDLLKIWLMVRRRRRALFGAVIVVVALSIVWLLQITPIYTATTQLLIDTRKVNTMAEAVVPELILNADTIATEISLIKSFSVSRRVAERLKLEASPQFGGAKPAITMVDWIGSLFASATVDGDASPQQDEAHTGAEESARSKYSPALRSAIGQVQSGLKIARLGVSYFLDVSFSHPDPKTAASIANAVAESYLDEQLEARYQAAQRAATWLSERVGVLRVQLEKSERALAEHRAKYNLAKPQAGTLAEQQAGEVNAQLVAARAQTVEKKAKYDQAQRILEGGAGIETVAAVMDSGAISGLRVQEAAVARQEADLLTRYGPEHPAILKVRAERADLARQIKREVGRVVQTLRTDYEFAQKKEQSLENSLQELTGGADHDEQPIIRLRELEREAESNRNLYQSMLGRFKEVQQQTTPAAAESRIVTPAFVPSTPSYPSKMRFMLIALCAGLAFGAGLVYLLEYLENGFTSVEQVEQALQLPVMATILRVTNAERRIDGRIVSIPEYTALRPLSRLGEGVRSARMTIQMSNIDRPPKVVLMTSARPGEGKTTMAVSFAVSTAASTKQQVLLIDGDLRARSLSKEFKLSDKAGLTDLLMEQFPTEQMLFRAEGSNLAVLPAGTTVTNPPDLLGSERMRLLMENLATHFDVIYVDAPPLLPVIDAAVLASIADKVVFVVHWRTTPRSAVPRALQLLDNSRRKVCGVVLNGVRAEQLANYDPQNAYYQGKYQGYYAQ